MKKAKSFYLCDLETTGKSPLNVEIVEIYLAHYQGRKLVKELHLYIRPRYWDKGADDSAEIHGITKEKAFEGTPWRLAMKEIWDFLPDEPAHFVCHANRRMFGHQGCFDWVVLTSHLLDIGFPFYQHFIRMFPPQLIISTHSLAKELLGIDKNRLGDVCDAMGIKIVKAHNAKCDAQATWKIFSKLSSQVDLDAFIHEDYYQLEKGVIPSTKSASEISEKSMTGGFSIFNTHDQGETYDENHDH